MGLLLVAIAYASKCSHVLLPLRSLAMEVWLRETNSSVLPDGILAINTHHKVHTQHFEICVNFHCSAITIPLLVFEDDV